MCHEYIDVYAIVGIDQLQIIIKDYTLPVYHGRKQLLHQHQTLSIKHRQKEHRRQRRRKKNTRKKKKKTKMKKKKRRKKKKKLKLLPQKRGRDVKQIRVLDMDHGSGQVGSGVLHRIGFYTDLYQGFIQNRVLPTCTQIDTTFRLSKVQIDLNLINTIFE